MRACGWLLLCFMQSCRLPVAGCLRRDTPAARDSSPDPNILHKRMRSAFLYHESAPWHACGSVHLQDAAG
jgi:hypothetical protein